MVFAVFVSNSLGSCLLYQMKDSEKHVIPGVIMLSGSRKLLFKGPQELWVAMRSLCICDFVSKYVFPIIAHLYAVLLLAKIVITHKIWCISRCKVWYTSL